MHCVHGGLLLATVCVSDGLERSQFWLYTQDGLEMSQMVLKGVIYGW